MLKTVEQQLQENTTILKRKTFDLLAYYRFVFNNQSHHHRQVQNYQTIVGPSALEPWQQQQSKSAMMNITGRLQNRHNVLGPYWMISKLSIVY